MATTPKEMLDFVMEHGMDLDFMTSVMSHVDNWSIGEITDRKFEKTVKGWKILSSSYGLDTPIGDEDILTALSNGLYVSAFISRFQDTYRVHFLVHAWPEEMKPKVEEEITRDVVRYMILQTILVLKLDNKEKIRKYCNAVKPGEQ